ncbi:hypothetical protein D3C72_1772520 [compost metagenome]
MSLLLVSTVAAFALILASSSATLPSIWFTQPCTTLPLASMVPLLSTSRGASAPVGTVSPESWTCFRVAWDSAWSSPWPHDKPYQPSSFGHLLAASRPCRSFSSAICACISTLDASSFRLSADFADIDSFRPAICALRAFTESSCWRSESSSNWVRCVWTAMSAVSRSMLDRSRPDTPPTPTPDTDIAFSLN